LMTIINSINLIFNKKYFKLKKLRKKLNLKEKRKSQ
jgi:hypothetical protein